MLERTVKLCGICLDIRVIECCKQSRCKTRNLCQRAQNKTQLKCVQLNMKHIVTTFGRYEASDSPSPATKHLKRRDISAPTWYTKP
jgi:hypothetical protein